MAIIPSNQTELLAFVSQDASEQGNLSIRGVAKMVGVDDMSIIRACKFLEIYMEDETIKPSDTVLLLDYLSETDSTLLSESFVRRFGLLGIYASTIHLFDGVSLGQAYKTAALSSEDCLKGLFQQTNKGKSKVTGYIYWIQQATTGYTKIGVSVDPYKRLSSLQVASPTRLTLIHKKRYNNCDLYEIEKRIHRQYKEYHVLGEWFALPQDVVTNLTKSNSKSNGLG
jgi:hypothetical protein